MERLENIINKLVEQHKQSEDPEKLLITTYMLLAELQQLHDDHSSSESKKVAVILPNAMPNFTFKKNGDDSKKEEYFFKRKNLEVNGSAKKNQVAEAEIKTKVDNHFDPVMDIPTLAHQKSNDYNNTASTKSESLNDKLKTSKSEIGSNLHHTPVRDLRKAIGINDRYLFINELFRGDEVMYERSIKTINSFTSLAEAEYWVTRELKTKLGWDDTSDNVQQFNQLLSRRFS